MHPRQCLQLARVGQGSYVHKSACCKTKHFSGKILSMEHQGAERVPEQRWEITDPIPSRYFPLLARWG